MIRRRMLARNTVWNLVGQFAPMGAALVAIPMLVHGMGTDRFGVLALAWVVIGYFSLFDFGLGRALTQLVARQLGSGELDSLPRLIWTAMVMMLLMGLAGTVLLGGLAPFLAASILHIPPALQGETRTTLYLLALALPVITMAAGLRGILEAHQRFDWSNLVRIPMGIGTFLGPLAVLPFSQKLPPIVAVTILFRLFSALVHGWFCLRLVPGLMHRAKFERAMVRPLITFGGWMTVSNILSPLMVNLDRLVIAGMLSVSAVAYYTVPYEVATKLLLVAGALVGVLFPAFGTTYAQDWRQSLRLYRRACWSLGFLIAPLALLMILGAGPGLRIWMGADFAGHSRGVLQALALGAFINAMAAIPFAFIQGIGRPDVTARFHLIEAPLYVVLLWGLVHLYGIQGAALAWVIRVSLDSALLYAWTLRHSKKLENPPVSPLLGRNQGFGL